MKDVFGDFFPLSNNEFDELIDQSIIVLDTNVLLDFYRYSPNSSENFFELLDEVTDQLWMPYQVGWEFLRSRAGVRVALTKDHTVRIDLLTKTLASLEQTAKRSRVTEQPEEKRFLSSLKRYIRELEKGREEIRRASSSPRDDLLETIAQLFEGRTQTKPDQKWHDDHEKVGAVRYKQQVPPGYMDASKESNKYGDYFVWAQCLEKAKEEARPMVIVTGDVKSDWWQLSDKKPIGPRHELLVEFNEETGQRLHIFGPLQFFRHLAGRRERSDSDAITETETEIASVQSEHQHKDLWGPSMAAKYASLQADMLPLANWPGMEEVMRPYQMQLSDLNPGITEQAQKALRQMQGIVRPMYETEYWQTIRRLAEGTSGTTGHSAQLSEEDDEPGNDS